MVRQETGAEPHSQIDGRAAWLRLLIAVAIGTIGGVASWSVVVVLPAVQAEFGIARADASMPYTAAMIGLAVGGVILGKITDRFGIMVPVLGGGIMIGAGYVVSGLAPNIWVFALAHGVLIGALGAAVVFGPLMADVSLWFRKRRGIAVALCACGNYLAGGIWPQALRFMLDAYGWRTTHFIIAAIVVLTMTPLALLLRRKAPALASGGPAGASAAGERNLEKLGLSPNLLMLILSVAGFACCVAMAMPQVHIVAYCVDLGYGVARGADMLSLMLGLGIVSRIGTGFIADRIGGLAALLLASTLQGAALLLFLTSDELTSLYVFSALFGLFQGGLIPCYAIIVREYFPPGEAAYRVGVVLMATLLGMAAGGWLSGVIYDLTRSYQAAFINGILWNVVNLVAIGWLLRRREVRARLLPAT